MKSSKRIRKTAFALVCALILGGLFIPAEMAQAAKASANDSFFSDAVFLGDSLTVGLEEYVETLRSSDSAAFSNALFLAKVSYGARTSQNSDGSSYHPYWKGEQLQPQKSIAKMKVSKVFIMLGINDVKEDLDQVISDYKSLVKAIQDACPGIAIYVQSVLPMTPAKESGTMTNSRINSLNSKLSSMCSSLKITFIDITDSFKNSSGALRSSYSSDDYVHLSKEGYAVWVEALRSYASGKSSQGSVMNISSALNLRSAPSMSASVVTKLRNGESVTIEEAFIDYEWHKVSVGGATGYLHKDYVYLDSVSHASGKIIKVSDFVNARSKPSANADLVCTIKKGAEVKVVSAHSTSNWYLVYYNNTYMYVRKDFVSIN